MVIFEDVIALSGVHAGLRLLEIGCGTGHVTREFAARGFAIECVELGANMAAIARAAGAVSKSHGRGCGFRRLDDGSPVRIGVLRHSYYWLDPATREQNIARILRSSGWLAFWKNHHIRNGSSDQFLDDAGEVSAAEAPALIEKRGRLAGADEVRDGSERTSRRSSLRTLRIACTSGAYGIPPAGTSAC